MSIRWGANKGPVAAVLEPMPKGHAQYPALAAAAVLILTTFASPAFAAWSHPAVAVHTTPSSLMPLPVVTVGPTVVTTTTTTSGSVTTTVTTTKTPTMTTTMTDTTNANGSTTAAVKSMTVTTTTTVTKTTTGKTPVTPKISKTKAPAGFVVPPGFTLGVPVVTKSSPTTNTTESESGGVTTTRATTKVTKTIQTYVLATDVESNTCDCSVELRTVTEITGTTDVSTRETTTLAPVTTMATSTSTGEAPPSPAGADTTGPNLFAAAGSLDVVAMVLAASGHTDEVIQGCQADTPPCIADALDAYAEALRKLAPYLPPQLRTLPTIVATAAKKVRSAKTTAEAVRAVKTAIAEVHKRIALLRADDPDTRQLGTREGTLVVETLQVASDKLERAVGL